MAKRKINQQVEADAAAADKLGISYGEYKARQHDELLNRIEAAKREIIKRQEERRNGETT